MDSYGNNLVICGRTKNPALSYNPSFYVGFIGSFTKGMMLNFHLTIDTLSDVKICHVMFGFNDTIQSAFSTTLSNSVQDALIFF